MSELGFPGVTKKKGQEGASARNKVHHGWLGMEAGRGGGGRKSTAVSPCGVIVLLGSELRGPVGLRGPQSRTNAPSGQGQSFRNEGNDPISGYPSSSVIFPGAGEREAE